MHVWEIDSEARAFVAGNVVVTTLQRDEFDFAVRNIAALLLQFCYAANSQFSLSAQTARQSQSFCRDSNG